MADNADMVKALSKLISSSCCSYSQKLSQCVNIDDEALTISAACKELDALLTPPKSWINRIAGSYNYSAAICLALDLDIPRILSEHNTIALYLMAEQTGAAISLLRCVMALCVECRIFDEPHPEVYALNNLPNLRKLSEHAASMMDSELALVYRSMPSRIHIKYPTISIRQHLGWLSKYVSSWEGSFSLLIPPANMSFYQYYHSADQRRGLRFDSAMERYFHRSAQTPIEDIFSFHDLQPGATLVDVGGGRGHHSIRLANQFPDIYFTVQDLEKKASTLKTSFDESVFTIISWQQHDFFKEQPVKGANIYFLSHILMDHSDSECRNILESLVEAMEPSKSILLIDDFLDAGKERTLRSKGNFLNLHHMAAFGRPFRTMHEWKDILLATSSSLYIANASTYDSGRVVFNLGRST